MTRDIEETLRALLFEKQALSALSARKLLTESGRAVSLVSVYKALNKLVAKNVAIKSGELFIVSLTWLVETRDRLDNLHRTMLHGPFATEALQLPRLEKSGESCRWHFPSIAEANIFWVQLLIILTARDALTEIHEFVPRLWFAYLPQGQDTFIQRALKQIKTVIHVYVGGYSALDRELAVKRPQARSYNAIYIRGFGSGSATRYYCAIGPWLIHFDIPRSTARALDTLYEHTLRDSPETRHSIVSLLQSKADCRLTLSYAPKEANLFRARLIRARVRKPN